MGDTQSITDVSHLTKDFNELNNPTKIHALLEMVKLCSYQQQMEFQDKLNQLLYKDFITQLPTDLSTKIISCLSMKDAINCLIVSKDWHKIVSDCEEYWVRRARISGLSGSFIASRLADPNSKLHSLCIAASVHQEFVKGLKPRVVSISKNLAGTGFTHQYTSHGVVVHYEELSLEQAVVTIECIGSNQSPSEIASFNVGGRIKWVSASSDYVLWNQTDGKWCGVNTKGLIPELDVWDDEPLPSGYHSISFCSRCHLVAVMAGAEDDCEVWDMQVIKLDRESGALRKMVYPVPLEGVKDLLEKKRYFIGGEVTLLPGSLEVDGSGFCKTHSVLLQVDSSLAIHKLKTLDDMDSTIILPQLLPNSLLSKPQAVLTPAQQADQQEFNLMGLSVSTSKPSFCLSADFQRVGTIYESCLYVWSLSSFALENQVDLVGRNVPSDSELIAVGAVYAIIASKSKKVCTVLLTATGEVLLQSGLSQSNSIVFYAPIEQAWLDNFVYSESLCVCLATHSERLTDQREQVELKALVGVTSKAKSLSPLSLTP